MQNVEVKCSVKSSQTVAQKTRKFFQMTNRKQTAQGEFYEFAGE